MQIYKNKIDWPFWIFVTVIGGTSIGMDLNVISVTVTIIIFILVISIYSVLAIWRAIKKKKK